MISMKGIVPMEEFDIKEWMDLLIGKLQDAFMDRLRFVGIQYGLPILESIRAAGDK